MDTATGSVTTTKGSGTISLRDSACIHCGDEVTPDTSVIYEEKLFCCAGCVSVYRFIHELGLSEFYNLKDTNSPTPYKVTDTRDYSYLNTESFKKQYTLEGEPNTMVFYIEGVHCSACLWLIERIPQYESNINSVQLDMSTNLATVRFHDTTHFSSFPDMISKLGYRAHPVKDDDHVRELLLRENRWALIRLAVAGVAAGNIMLLSAAIYSGADGFMGNYFGLINMILAIPVVSYCAYPFYKSVLRSLNNRQLTVDIPIVFVILVGFILSTYGFFRGSDQVYFDSITVFVFLLLASRYVLSIIRSRVSDHEPLSNSIFSSDKTLVWDKASKQYFYQPTHILRPGDRIKLERGDRVPVDGVLAGANATLNLSVLSGESIPVTALRGDAVYAGSIVLGEQTVVEVEKTKSDTRIGKILDKIDKNYDSTPQCRSFASRYSTIFTLLVVVSAFCTFGAVSVLYGSAVALDRVIALVLISCPCAFVIALPLIHGLSLKGGLNKGFIVKDLGVLERFGAIDNIFFDKTGTLTKGVFKVLRWDLDDMGDDDLSAVLAIERMSSHPVARSIVSYLSQKRLNNPVVTEMKTVPLRGVEAVVNGHSYRIVSDIEKNHETDFNQIVSTQTLIFKDDKPISTVYLGDSLKEDAKFVLNQLGQMDYDLFILSGDKEGNVKSVAQRLQIPLESAYWGKTPEEKSEIVSGASGSLMVGDGLNDTGAMSSADASVSVQGGVEESLKVSDVYILNNDLYTLLDIFQHADLTRQTIRRNSVFSVLYNVGGGALAVMGYVGPLVAAVLMPLSSVLLIASSVYGYNKMSQRRGGYSR